MDGEFIGGVGDRVLGRELGTCECEGEEQEEVIDWCMHDSSDFLDKNKGVCSERDSEKSKKNFRNGCTRERGGKGQSFE